MKVTLTQIMDFVYALPINIDYPSPDYGRVSIEQDYMTDKVTEWLRSMNVEVVEE